MGRLHCGQPAQLDGLLVGFTGHQAGQLGIALDGLGQRLSVRGLHRTEVRQLGGLLVGLTGHQLGQLGLVPLSLLLSLPGCDVSARVFLGQLLLQFGQLISVMLGQFGIAHQLDSGLPLLAQLAGQIVVRDYVLGVLGQVGKIGLAGLPAAAHSRYPWPLVLLGWRVQHRRPSQITLAQRLLALHLLAAVVEPGLVPSSDQCGVGRYRPACAGVHQPAFWLEAPGFPGTARPWPTGVEAPEMLLCGALMVVRHGLGDHDVRVGIPLAGLSVDGPGVGQALGVKH